MGDMMGASSDGRLAVALQENLLVLLCFSRKAAPIIRNTIRVQLFSSQLYRDTVTRVYEYLDAYKEPPAEHLPDLFEELEDKDSDAGRQLVDLIEALFSQRDKVNEDYALAQLSKFVRQQSLKASIIAASESLQEGDLDAAEVAIQKGMKDRVVSFAPGMRLTEGIRRIYSHQVRRDVVPLGIKEIDKAHLGPGRGEVHLFIGPPKRGKSWWLVHVTKRCLMHRLPTVYITLELSEAQIAQRLMQSLFSISRYKERIPVTRLRADDLGRLIKFEQDNMAGRLSLDDPSSRGVVERKLTRLRGNENLVIKQFPAGQLTVRALEAFLDMLEQSEGFVPVMVVIDYPDYMKIDPKNYRLEMGAVLNDLRGLAVERDVGIIVAKRSNKEGTKARMVDETHAAEDYSAIYTADTIFTYSQTMAEKQLGLARLLVSNTRVADRDGFVLLISQAYKVGQFCLESVMMTEKYWGQLEQAGVEGVGRDAEEAE